MRVTKVMLEAQVDLVNKLCKERGIDKEYELGYRNGCTMLDEKSQTNPGCIIRSIAHGTKTEVSRHLHVIAAVLR